MTILYHISFFLLISAKILLFYVIFYAVLAGFFGAMLTVFYQTLDPNAPKWQLDNSLIGSNPGLGFRPMPPSSNVESTLIWYKASDEGNFLHWTRELDKFLEGEQVQIRKKFSTRPSLFQNFKLVIKFLTIRTNFSRISRNLEKSPDSRSKVFQSKTAYWMDAQIYPIILFP